MNASELSKDISNCPNCIVGDNRFCGLHAFRIREFLFPPFAVVRPEPKSAVTLLKELCEDHLANTRAAWRGVCSGEAILSFDEAKDLQKVGILEGVEGDNNLFKFDWNPVLEDMCRIMALEHLVSQDASDVRYLQGCISALKKDAKETDEAIRKSFGPIVEKIKEIHAGLPVEAQEKK